MLEARRSCALLTRAEMEQGQGPHHAHDRLGHRRHPGQEAVKHAARPGDALGRGIRLRGRSATRATSSPTAASRTAPRTRRTSRSRCSTGGSARPGSATCWSGSARTSAPARSSRRTRTCWRASLRAMRRGGALARLARQGDRGAGPVPAMRRAPNAEDVSHPRTTPTRRLARPDARPTSGFRRGTSWAAGSAWISVITSSAATETPCWGPSHEPPPTIAGAAPRSLPPGGPAPHPRPRRSP